MQDGGNIVSRYRSCQQVCSAGHAATERTMGMPQGQTYTEMSACLAAEHASP